MKLSKTHLLCGFPVLPVIVLTGLIVTGLLHDSPSPGSGTTNNAKMTAAPVQPGAANKLAHVSSPVDPDAYQLVQRAVAKKEYHISQLAKEEDSYSSINRNGGLMTKYDNTGLQVSSLANSPVHTPWEYNISVKEVYGGLPGTANKLSPAGSRLSGDTLRFIYAEGLAVEYINNESGLRQNFIVGKEMVAEDCRKIKVVLQMDGDLQPRDGNENEILFVSGKGEPEEGAAVLKYHDLRAWDSKGNLLSASMHADERNKEIIIETDVANASFPVTIDPITTGVADVIATGQKTNGHMGYSVASAGDINGDGYSDLVVGAAGYTMNGTTDQGAAFVYYGSGAGVSLAICDTLWEPTLLPSSLYGASVSSAGDVNGDGYSDIIVGASRASISFADEGAAFIYLGSASGITQTAAVTLKANQPDARFGTRVALAGDVDRDGYSDVIIGASTYTNMVLNEGAAFVYWGGPGGITTTSPFTPLYSGQGVAEFGWSVAGAGDVNGDGLSDIVVGARRYDFPGVVDEGMTLILKGRTDRNLTAVTPDTLRATGQASSEFGNSVASAGDVNGDGYSDIIVGAYLYTVTADADGAVYVFHGRPGSMNMVAPDKTYLGTPGANSWFGYCVAPAGDFDADGYSDVLVGSLFFANGGLTEEGAVNVYKGGPGGLSTTPFAVLESNNNGGRAGYSTASAGDLNGDGYSDIIMGVPYYTGTFFREGAWYVYYGAPKSLDPSAPNLLLERNQPGSQLGYSVNSAGDINGDGYNDAVAGAPGYNSNQGQISIYYGSATGLSSAPVNITGPQAGAYFGYSVSTAGDVDGDGYSDIIVGAYNYITTTNVGAVFIYRGGPSGISAAAVPDYILTGTQAGARFGWSVATAGDINNDGYSDVMVGIPSYQNTLVNEGSAAIYYGSATGVANAPNAQVYGGQANAYFGYSVAGIGDTDGDAYADLAIGAPQYSSRGRISVFFGSFGGIIAASPVNILSPYSGNSLFGYCLNAAGDLNGDGFSDLCVGAPSGGTSSEGAVVVFYGKSAPANFHEFPTSAGAIIESNYTNGGLGNGNSAVASAGDINGDGYSDIVAGAPRFFTVNGAEGIVFFYFGGPTGVATTPSATTPTSGQVNSDFGWSVTSLGDVNGDGHGDIGIGAPKWTNPEANEGRVFVYYGGNANGMAIGNMQLFNNDLSTLITSSNIMQAPFGVEAYARSFIGRGRMKLVWEIQPASSGFTQAGGRIGNSVYQSGEQAAYSLTPLAGQEMKALITKPSVLTMYKVRTRIKYELTTAITGQVYSPWKYLPGYLRGEAGSGNAAHAALNNNTPLAVSTKDFRAELVDCRKVKISWQVNNEETGSVYVVEQSMDGQTYAETNRVNAPGNNAANAYTLYTIPGRTGRTSYRLKVIMANGGISYSNTVSVVSNCNEPALITVETYPNPVAEKLTIRFNRTLTGNAKISVVNQAGQLVRNETRYLNNAGDMIVDVQRLLPGYYYVKIGLEDEPPVVTRIVVAHR